MDIYVLSSGSKGNMTLIQSQNRWVCVDVGITIKKIEEKMKNIPFTKGTLCDVLITHEHGDHIQGLKAFVSKGYVHKIYLNEKTYLSLKEDVIETIKDSVVIFKDSMFDIDSFKITPFNVSHDAADPVGFSIENESKKVVVITDTGYFDEACEQYIKHADAYLIEANHQPDKLLHSLRPMQLKRRILSEKGHLSNEDAVKLINKVMKHDITHWIVMHISEDCNSELDIEKAVVKYLENPLHIMLHYTGPNIITAVSI